MGTSPDTQSTQDFKYVSGLNNGLILLVADF